MTGAHRTAIVRGDLSRPIRLALAIGLITEATSFFDYGCGRGEDIAGLREQGIDAAGWDPYFRPDEPVRHADVVNLGYVVNVIADPRERRQTLLRAWHHCGSALIVSARLTLEQRDLTVGRPSGDGFVTSKGTFQRFFTQSELREWVDAALGVDSIAMAPGIFVAFRSEQLANEFMMRIPQRRAVRVRISRADRIYDENRETLDQLIEFFSNRGRLPGPAEYPELEAQVREGIGSYKRAWQVVRRVSSEADWDAVAAARTDDLLVELALLKLNRRPNFNALPVVTRLDVRALLGSYTTATAEADQLLYSAGDLEVVDDMSKRATVGKRLPTAHYVHSSALPALPRVLRVYEGCARWLVGDVEDANIIKLATDKPKVSYLAYPQFDSDPHPALAHATFVRLRGLEVDTRDYASSSNPPILHRKEKFVAPDYPSRDKFARLTAQEERFSLLGVDTRLIGTRDAWEARLDQLSLKLNGHRVVRSTTARR